MYSFFNFLCSLEIKPCDFCIAGARDETHEQFLYSFDLCSQVCLGAEAEDKFHTVEMEGLTYDGKTTKITLAVLKPSVLPCVSVQVFSFFCRAPESPTLNLMCIKSFIPMTLVFCCSVPHFVDIKQVLLKKLLLAVILLVCFMPWSDA